MKSNPLEQGEHFDVAFTGFTPKFSYPKSKGPLFKVQFETTRLVWGWFQEASLAGLQLAGSMAINPTGEDDDTFHNLELLNPSPSASKPQGGECYRITFEVDRGTWLWMLDYVRLDDVIGARLYAGEVKEDKPDGKHSSALHRNGFLIAPPVVETLGKDADYQDWVRNKPCIVCGDGDYYQGSLRNEYAHVRRAGDSGTGYKPVFSGIPLCHTHHALQHNQGYTELLLTHRKLYDKLDSGAHLASLDEAMDWLTKQAGNHLEAWAHEKLRDVLGVESLSDAAPEEIYDWALSHDLSYALPSSIKEASGA